jgi:ERCC4-type nuclease
VIYVDDRVGSAELLPLLQSHRTKPDCQLKRLLAADLCFSGNGSIGPCMVGIERKRVARGKDREDGRQFRDITESIRHGRLVGEQLPTLLDLYEYVFIFIEGIFKTDYSTGYLMQLRGREWEMVLIGKQPYYAKELYSFMTTLTLNTRVQCLITTNADETVEHTARLYEYFQKPWGKHHELMTLHTPPNHVLLGKAGTVRRVAAALDGVGWERSQTVAERFKSVDAMVGAEVKDWVKLPGFGKVLAMRVWGELHGEYKGKDEGGVEL